MQTLKQVLIKACKEETVNLSFMLVCIFILNLINMLLFIFRLTKIHKKYA